MKEPASQESRPVYVWDLPTRIFHWLLAVSVATAASTGFVLGAKWLSFHLVAGILALALVNFRVLWGFLGSPFSRFASFPPNIDKAWQQLKSFTQSASKPHAGHNPLGALMVYTLLATITVLGITGFLVWGGILKQGPFKALLGFETASTLQVVHEFAAWFLLALVIAHLCGVIAESLRERINLTRAMITGIKVLPLTAITQRPNVKIRIATTVAASAALSLVAGALAGLGMTTAPLGVPQGPMLATYVKDCGDCHMPYHPSLLSGAQWQAILEGLPDHFGEDASLEQKSADEIAAYLAGNASEHFDTKPAHLLPVNASSEPLRITTSQFWQATHAELDPGQFTTTHVKSKSNCEACHVDARSGLFAPQSISIPKETKP